MLIQLQPPVTHKSNFFERASLGCMPVYLRQMYVRQTASELEEDDQLAHIISLTNLDSLMPGYALGVEDQ